jgi:hypothetical protein
MGSNNDEWLLRIVFADDGRLLQLRLLLLLRLLVVAGVTSMW